jgi:hypothetical protein
MTGKELFHKPKSYYKVTKTDKKIQEGGWRIVRQLNSLIKFEVG